MPYDDYDIEDLDLDDDELSLIGALETFADMPAELESDDDDEIGDDDDDDDMSGEDELEQLESELAAMESEYGADDNEVGALPRSRFRRARSYLSRYRKGRTARGRRSASRWRNRYAKMRRKKQTAVKYAKRNAQAVKKNAKIAKKLLTEARKDVYIGQLTGFSGNDDSFARMSGSDTTVILTGNPQKDVEGGQLIIDETPSAGAAPGASVVNSIQIGVYPLLSSKDGVALRAFNQDATLNQLKWPKAYIGNEIVIRIERSAAPGTDEEVVYTAALGPYRLPRTVTKVRK